MAGGRQRGDGHCLEWPSASAVSISFLSPGTTLSLDPRASTGTPTLWLSLGKVWLLLQGAVIPEGNLRNRNVHSQGWGWTQWPWRGHRGGQDKYPFTRVSGHWDSWALNLPAGPHGPGGTSGHFCRQPLKNRVNKDWAHHPYEHSG